MPNSDQLIEHALSEHDSAHRLLRFKRPNPSSGEPTMPGQSTRSWKMERASMTVGKRARPRSNKYSRSDTSPRPKPGARARIWVGAYTRGDGQKVAGYYRSI
jgi:hypothetical protein